MRFKFVAGGDQQRLPLNESLTSFLAGLVLLQVLNVERFLIFDLIQAKATAVIPVWT